MMAVITTFTQEKKVLGTAIILRWTVIMIHLTIHPTPTAPRMNLTQAMSYNGTITQALGNPVTVIGLLLIIPPALTMYTLAQTATGILLPSHQMVMAVHHMITHTEIVIPTNQALEM